MYDFIDTTTLNSGDWRSPEALSIDGAFLEDHIAGYHTLTVSGRESIEYSVSDQDRPIGVNGMDYYGKRMGAREIVVAYQMMANTASELMQQYRALVAFCSGENRELRFADELNAHYTGTLEKIDSPDPGQLAFTSSMTFYCADPNLISDVITTVNAVMVDGVLTANINNKGSAEAYPTYRIKHNGENGYIGIVSPEGAFEMGNIEEADGYNYTQSEYLTKKLSDFVQYTGANPQNSSLLTTSTLSVNSAGELVMGTKTNESGAHGGCVKYTLKADSNGEIGAVNFYCWCGIKFVVAKNQTGLIQILFTDENDELLFGYGCFKSNRSNTTGRAVAWVGNSSSANQGEFKAWNFDCRDNKNNPFGSARGSIDVLKTGGKIRFYHSGKYYETNIPSIAEKKVTNAYVYIGKWGSDNNWPDMRAGKVTFYIRKDQVEKFNDVPNRYSSGSEIAVNAESDTITIDGLPANDEIVTGSEFISLPPGDTKIEFAVSSWCTPVPTVTVEYRERWL